jgi:hypothetical protein
MSQVSPAGLLLRLLHEASNPLLTGEEWRSIEGQTVDAWEEEYMDGENDIAMTDETLHHLAVAVLRALLRNPNAPVSRVKIYWQYEATDFKTAIRKNPAFPLLLLEDPSFCQMAQAERHCSVASALEQVGDF